MAEGTGTGMFPRALMERFLLLPIEEDGWLNDMPLRSMPFTLFLRKMRGVASAPR